MERFYNSKRHNMTNYLDIFKACRLCGSGGGYKMPIIQKLHNDDVIDVEAELKQKIRECVSIDVHPDDRMPPLICELCVDKVNDFYEFREMCRATNARVRASLGLPPQSLSQDVNEDCILGVSGPLFHGSIDNDSSPKKEKLKTSKKGIDKKSLRSHEPSPPILDRSSRRRHTDSPLLGSSSKKARYSSPSESPFLDKKKQGKSSDSLAAEAKRLRESRDNKPQDVKKGNLLQKQKELLAQKAKEREARAKEVAAKAKAIQKSKEAAQRAKELKEIQKAKEAKEAQKAKLAEQKAKEAALKKKQAAAVLSTFKCDHCTEAFSKQIEHRQHVNFLHTPLYMDEKLACTPCGEWFASMKDADAHHKWHKTSNTYYTCQRCSTDFKVLMGFTKHFQRKQCIPYETVPDVKCNVCMGMFATENWMQQHKCPGPPKDMCKKCMSVFQGRVALKRHERRCKGIIVPLNPNNPHLKDLRPLSIAVDRCDNLVRRIKTEPGLLTSIKQEPMDFEESTIHIKQEIKQEMEDYNSDYGSYGGMDDGHYSSDGSVSETDAPQAPHLVLNPFARKNTTQVDSLSIISLRTIFGGKLLGKRTRRKKKKKNPKLEAMNFGETTSANQTVFDSLFNDAMATDTNADQGDGHEMTDGVDKDSSDHNADQATSENNESGTDFDSLKNPTADTEQHDSTVEQSLSNSDVHLGGHDETLVENVLNEIVEKTDAQLDGATEEDSETIPDLLNNDLTSHVDHSATESIDQLSHINNMDVDFTSVDTAPTPSIKCTKTFVQGFALDPEVEALLMEDDEIPSNTLSLKDKEALESEISMLQQGSIMSKHVAPVSDAKEQHSEDVATTNVDQTQGTSNVDEVSQGSVVQTQVDHNLIDNSQPHELPNTVDDGLHQNADESVKELNSNDDVREDQQMNVVPVCDSEVVSKSEEIVGEQSVGGASLVCEDSDIAGGDALPSSDNVVDDARNVDSDTKRPDDVMDLISDSGDDCNIVDSPEKTKLLEDQLLLDDDKQSGDQDLLLDDEKQPGDQDLLLDDDKQSGDQDLLLDDEKQPGDQDLLLDDEKQLGNQDLLLDDKKQPGDQDLLLDDEKQPFDQDQLLHNEKQPVEEDLLLDDEKQSLDQSPLLDDEKQHVDQNQLLLNDEKQIDEESLLTTKDEVNVADLEMTEQDEDMLLGKDDEDNVPPQGAPAPSGPHQDLEKISDDEFDMD